jgi:hypothetical protein
MTISRAQECEMSGRAARLRAKYCGQPPTLRTPALETRILAKTRQAPPDGSSRWSTRKLAKVMTVSLGLMAQV